MNNSNNLVCKILVICSMVLALMTMFLPYYGGSGYGQSVSYSAITILSELSQFGVGGGVVAMMIGSWVLALAAIILCAVLRGRLAYILSLIMSGVSDMMMLMLLFSFPSISAFGASVGFQFGYWLYLIFGLVAIGASIAGIVTSGTSHSAIAPNANVFITGVAGEYCGAQIAVQGRLLIGRDPASCQLIVNDEKASRRHCSVAYSQNPPGYLVTDYSSNGTFVDGRGQLPRNVETFVPSGSVIQIGKRGDRFRLG